MNRYELISMIGEGAYGSVYKARRRETREIVAIKKFKDNADSSTNKNIKRTIMREIKMLRTLKHPNYVVCLQDQFKRRGRVHLIFEYIDKSLLDLLEHQHAGLSPTLVNQLLIQLLNAIKWCHSNSVIHRDIKPENLLVDSRTHQLKLCDFGFARSLQKHDDSAVTEYVATRWYRAPELLVGTNKHTTAVDMWPVGCIWVEMCSCEPLFAGESEIDQLYIIQDGVGKSLPKTLVKYFQENKKYKNMSLPDPSLYSDDSKVSIMRRLHKQHPLAISYFKQYHRLDLLIRLLELDPSERCTCDDALEFLENPDKFLPEIHQAGNKKVHVNKSTTQLKDRKRRMSKHAKQSISSHNALAQASTTRVSTSGIKLSKLTKRNNILTEILNVESDDEDFGGGSKVCGDYLDDFDLPVESHVKSFMKSRK